MSVFDLQIDFFLPLWRRVGVVSVCFVWALIEFAAGSLFWGVIFASLGAYAASQFFLSDWPTAKTTSQSPESSTHSPSEQSD